MKEVFGKISEEMHLKGEYVVPALMELIFCGSLTGSLHVLKGATAKIVGVIHGEIFNNGGSVIVLGSVIGAIATSEGETVIQASGKVIPLDVFLLTL